MKNMLFWPIQKNKIHADPEHVNTASEQSASMRIKYNDKIILGSKKQWHQWVYIQTNNASNSTIELIFAIVA